jgi:hypothetical protein
VSPESGGSGVPALLLRVPHRALGPLLGAPSGGAGVFHDGAVGESVPDGVAWWAGVAVCGRVAGDGGEVVGEGAVERRPDEALLVQQPDTFVVQETGGLVTALVGHPHAEPVPGRRLVGVGHTDVAEGLLAGELDVCDVSWLHTWAMEVFWCR